MLSKSGALKPRPRRVDPTLFIEEMGKTAVTTLLQPSLDILTKFNAGERLELLSQDKRLSIRTLEASTLAFRTEARNATAQTDQRRQRIHCSDHQPKQ